MMGFEDSDFNPKYFEKERIIASGEPITIANIAKNIIKTINIGQNGLSLFVDNYIVILICICYILI
jgi:hypothetical protein